MAEALIQVDVSIPSEQRIVSNVRLPRMPSMGETVDLGGHAYVVRGQEQVLGFGAPRTRLVLEPAAT